MSNLVWRHGMAVACAALLASVAWAGLAQAESIQKQCSAKYKTAKAANTLGGQNWNQFYKQCAAELKGAPAPAAATATPPAAAPKPATMPAAAPKPMHTTPSPTVTGKIVFPRAIAPQYASLSAGKARFKTCVDQYRANKATNSNGGLKWVQKGGGYYSECNKHLKGQ
ncbi:MAG: hypothetical protein ACYC5H_16200 [Methylovirgula sp.]